MGCNMLTYLKALKLIPVLLQIRFIQEGRRGESQHSHAASNCLVLFSYLLFFLISYYLQIKLGHGILLRALFGLLNKRFLLPTRATV